MWLEWAKKQYETEHNKKSYDEAIEALKKAEKKPHENPEKGKSKELSEKKVTFSLPYTKQKIIEIDGMKYNIVRIHKRPVVLVDIAGITVPFYITTGLGGKNLKPGRYPFFGYGKDEWLNKTHGKDMSNYYEKYVGSEVSMMWHSIAKDLAKTYGTDPRVFEDTKDPRDDSEDPLSNFAHKFEDYLNKQLIIIPTDNDTESTLTTVEQNIKDMGTEILFARNDKEHPREKSRENNIELVNVSPEKMNKIFEEHPHVGTLFKALVAQGKLTKLTFDPTTFVSEKRGNEISIGTKYQEGLRYQQNTLFNNETDDLARKLAHEMMHSITPEQVKNNSNLASLFIALKQLRAYDSKKGLSIIVSKYPGTYREANIQATEDMTELFAMYLIDPKHLKDYLSYLTTISKDDSDTLGLKKISPEVAKRIYDQVDTM
jgi:FtsZ-interacting cell division protein YlmF